MLLFTYSPAFTTRFFRNFCQTIPLRKFLKRAQTNRSIGARNQYSFFFPLFYNILISILQGFRILEGLFTLKKSTLASLAPFQILIQRIDSNIISESQNSFLEFRELRWVKMAVFWEKFFIESVNNSEDWLFHIFLFVSLQWSFQLNVIYNFYKPLIPMESNLIIS